MSDLLVGLSGLERGTEVEAEMKARGFVSRPGGKKRVLPFLTRVAAREGGIDAEAEWGVYDFVDSQRHMGVVLLRRGIRKPRRVGRGWDES